MAIKFEYDGSHYELSRKILDSCKDYGIAGIIDYLLYVSRNEVYSDKLCWNTSKWMEFIDEDDKLLATKYTHYDSHNKREETEWFIYIIIEDNMVLRITKYVNRLALYVFKDADKCIVETTQGDDGKLYTVVKGANGKPPVGRKQELIQPEVLPEKVRLVDIIEPVNLNDWVEKALGRSK